MKLSDVTRSGQARPPKVLVVGPPKVGKSTWASQAPAPIFIRTEDGLDALPVDAFPLATSHQDVLDALAALATEEHEFRTVVLDSVDWCEPLVHAAVCKAAGVPSIEKVGGGYGKGYIEADKVWRELLDALDYLRNHRKMGVVLIAHDQVVKVEPPDGDAYDMAGLKLHKRAVGILTEWADVIGYARVKRATKREEGKGFHEDHVRAVSLGQRVLTVGQNPAYLSGNRYGLPDELPLEYAAFSAAMDSRRKA